MSKYQFIEDSGHGWLKVPKAEADAMDVPFTPFSYDDGEHVYLEEDVDLSMFLHETVFKRLWDGQFINYNDYLDYLEYCREWLSKMPQQYSYRSRIRNLPGYKCPNYSGEKYNIYWKDYIEKRRSIMKS